MSTNEYFDQLTEIISPASAQPDIHSLEATISIVYGQELLADNTEGDAAMFATFEQQIKRRYH